jgi:leucyl-tRNA synthetase
VEVDSEQAVVEALAKTHSNVEKAMSGVQIKKTIFVKNRIINFIV